jgi:flavorubredoxin
MKKCKNFIDKDFSKLIEKYEKWLFEESRHIGIDIFSTTAYFDGNNHYFIVTYKTTGT